MPYLPFLLASILFGAGLTKASGLKMQKDHFRHWNLPYWFMYAIGVLEIVAAVLLLQKASCYTGAVLSGFVMLGAVATCWIVSDYKRSLLPLGLLVIAMIICWNISPASVLSYGLIIMWILGLMVAAILWAYPATPPNEDGEIEFLDKETSVRHQFRKALGVRYHYVTAGDPLQPTVVLIHGAPESWYAWHEQIIALSKAHRVIALDMKPYGQTENDLDGDHSFSHIAAEIKVLLDDLGVEQFYLAAHDRGVIASDHLLAKEGMSERILGYIRMQQSFDQPHGDPLPPHGLMGSFVGTMAYKLRFNLWLLYNHSAYVKNKLATKTVARIQREFHYKGIPQAVPLSFKTTSFPDELEDRRNMLFKHMTMPVLILQGQFDPGQHPEEYALSHRVVPNLRVQFIESSHFTHTEAPKEVNEAILHFIETTLAVGNL